MAPKAFQRPPDLSTKYDRTPDTLEKSIDNIILSEDDFTKVERMPSGTILTTRKQSTPDELAAAKAERIARRSASNLARGSADCAGGYEDGLELKAEAPHERQPLSDKTTTRIDR